MSVVMFLADNEKCPVMVIGLDLNLGLSSVPLCSWSFKWSFKRLVLEAVVVGLNWVNNLLNWQITLEF